MAAVDDDMPSTSPPAELGDAEPAGQPGEQAVAGRRRNRLLSDDELRLRHAQPEIGELVVDVRSYMFRTSKKYPFAGFARLMHENARAGRSRTTRLSSSDKEEIRRLAGALSAQSLDSAGFSVDTMAAALRLLVPDHERQAKVRQWTELTVRAGKARPDFGFLPPSAPSPAQERVGHRPSAGEPVSKDEIIAEQQARLIAHAATITELLNSRARLRAETRSIRRYEVLATRPPASIDDIDAAVQMICAALGEPGYLEKPVTAAEPPLLDLDDDMAVTAENWRDGGVSSKQWTVITPMRIVVVPLIAIVIAVYVMIAFQVVAHQ